MDPFFHQFIWIYFRPLQKWFKKILFSKRLTKLISQLIPLYYHPEAKGGYIHKRDMLIYIETIHNK